MNNATLIPSGTKKTIDDIISLKQNEEIFPEVSKILQQFKKSCSTDYEKQIIDGISKRYLSPQAIKQLSKIFAEDDLYENEKRGNRQRLLNKLTCACANRREGPIVIHTGKYSNENVLVNCKFHEKKQPNIQIIGNVGQCFLNDSRYVQSLHVYGNAGINIACKVTSAHIHIHGSVGNNAFSSSHNLRVTVEGDVNNNAFEDLSHSIVILHGNINKISAFTLQKSHSNTFLCSQKETYNLLCSINEKKGEQNEVIYIG